MDPDTESGTATVWVVEEGSGVSGLRHTLTGED